jgi:hypothetical protein
MIRPVHLVIVAFLALGCAASEAGETDATAEQSGQNSRIVLAESAGPPAIASPAMIVEFDATGGATELRAGTNGWLCLPDDPATPGTDPMCADPVWQAWLEAHGNRTTPDITRLGIAYMLQGGQAASNDDPFATEPAPGQEWIEDGPHLMLLVPNPRTSLQGISTDPKSGGPHVMWAGTDYAHVMVPIGR